jgi:serine/threonine protein kinase/TolB-like protein/tetratricopeptide (TPR) repeat protein
MDAERWQRARELFEAALARDRSERSAFLARACAGDDSLRAEVERRLGGDDGSGSFVKQDDRDRNISADPGGDGREPGELHHTFSPDQILCGRFKVTRFICRGGMGEVYEARDLELGGRLALKTIRPEISANPENLRRFKQEIQLARKVTDPNVCRIFDLELERTRSDRIDGKFTEVAFLTMELLEGETLNDALRRKSPMSTAEALPLIRQMAQGLTAAHDAGVIHRDFKPSNVMLVSPPDADAGLRAVVTDFGLARGAAPPGSSATTTAGTEATASAGSPASLLIEDNAPVGTLAYMAPEQIECGALTTATDIYAFGLVIYEMVTGHRVFGTRTSLADAQRTLSQPIPSPRTRVQDLDRKWETTIVRCLEADPALRFQSAREVVRSLEGKSSGSARRDAWVTYALGAVAILAVLVGLNVHGVRDGLTHFFHPEQIRSIAVLPLENLSGQADQDYFAEGMTDELITDLAKISALKVISRTSVMEYKGTHKPVSEVARALKVDAVVEGTVLRSGDRVRITARLIDAHSDGRIWGESYDRDLRDVLALQSEVATSIADQIRITVTSQEHARLQRTRQVNTAAYEAYLRGRYEWNKGTERDKQQAREYFEQAVKIDPNYASAYSGLADYYWSTDVLPPSVAMPEAKRLALKALKLDPDLAGAYTSLAVVEFYADWNWSQADDDFRRALNLDPADMDAHRVYSDYLSAMGRASQAVDQSRAAETIDPVSLDAQVATGWALYYGRHYGQALAECGTVRDLEPHFASAHDCLGVSYLAEKAYDRAIAESGEAVKLSGEDLNIAVGLARACALGGNKAEARAILDQWQAKAKSAYVPPSLLAQIYFALGERKEGFRLLETAYAGRDVYLARLRVEPAFDPVRSDPQFQDLIRRMNFPPERASQHISP